MIVNYNHGFVGGGELARLLMRQHRNLVARGSVRCVVCEANKERGA